MSSFSSGKELPSNGLPEMHNFEFQSLFILSPSRDTVPDKNVPIDVDSLSTFDIVWLARGSLERGDLEQVRLFLLFSWNLDLSES